MARKNRRERVEPLDLTDLSDRPQREHPAPLGDTRWHADNLRMERERKAAARRRQAEARANAGIDWSTCLVPTCGEELFRGTRPMFDEEPTRDHTAALPLCMYHLGVAFEQGKSANSGELFANQLSHITARIAAAADNVVRRRRETNTVSIDGHIYALRQNGYIKVGWSRQIDDRLRSYGPDVDVLVIFPGTRRDETDLHRRFTPARARGREWYEDGQILGDWIAEQRDRWGEPDVYDTWTRPTKFVASKRFSA